MEFNTEVKSSAELTPTSEGDRQHKNFKDTKALVFIMRCPFEQFLKWKNRYILFIHDVMNNFYIFQRKIYKKYFFLKYTYRILFCIYDKAFYFILFILNDIMRDLRLLVKV